jgi:serine phosphatase RsbU (regulator of sigma subunit)/PAS domain-containing protein
MRRFRQPRAERAAVGACAALAGGLAVALAGRMRFERALADERSARAHADLLGRAVRLVATSLDPDVRLQELAALPIPDLADVCSLDVLRDDGTLELAAVAAADPAIAAAVRDSRARWPIDPAGVHPIAVAARTGEPQLVADVTPEHLRQVAQAEGHRERMARMGYRSGIAVPLAARGRTLGALALMRIAGEPYSEQDRDLAAELARRAALAVDNARLFAELTQTERQLEAVLANLGEAVTVQGPDFGLVYANRAAARLLECATTEELLRTPMAEILGRFVVLDEQGLPLDLTTLPGRAALAGETPEPILVRYISRATGDEHWMLVKATPVRGDDGRVALAVNIMEEVTEARRAERRQRFLAETSKLVSSSLDMATTLDKLAWAVVPEVADWCIVDMPDARGVVRPVAMAHIDGVQRERLAEMRAHYPPGDSDESPAGVVRHGRAALIPEVTDEQMAAYARDEHHLELMRALETRSVAVVPLAAGDRTIGTITVATAESGRRLGPEELALLEEVGRRAGIAVENARVHAARTTIATTLQRSLLPPRLPVVPGVMIAARFRAAGEASDVGGDFYDLFPLADGWMVVIGDVTGKGPEAAAITSLARYTMRTAAVYERSPAGVLAQLNLALAGDPDRRRLCTAVCARISARPDGRVGAVVASGGHPPPFLLRDGRVEVAGRSGPLLGAFEAVNWPEHHELLGPGESLVLYTDGVTDTRGRDDERFGQDRLAGLLAECGDLDPDEVANRVDAALLAFQDGDQRDDVALLVLRASGRPLAEAALVASGTDPAAG